MYIIDLSFVLYKYNVYFQQQKKQLSNSKREKIDDIIKKIEEILSIPINELCDNLSINNLNSYVFNTTFPNDIEYIKHLSKGSNLSKNEKIINKLFKRLIELFGNICETNIIFNEKEFINKVLKYDITEKNINLHLDKDKKDIDEEDYTVLNLEEYKNNLKELGLPYFEY